VHSHTELRAIYRYGYIIFAILASAYFFVYFHRLTVSVIGSDIVEEVGGTIGGLSSAYFWTYTAMQIPSGILADRFGPRKATALFLSVAALGSFITSVGDSFEMMVIGKMLIAAGMAVVYIPLMKIISVWFKKDSFPQLTGITIAVGNIGAIAAAAPLSMLSDQMGWREVFLMLGIVTTILAILCALFVRDHPHRKGFRAIEEVTGMDTDDETDGKLPALKGLRIVFSSGRAFWMLALAYMLIYGTIMAFQGTWVKTYFDNAYSFGVAVIWLITSIGVGKILSTILVGFLTGKGVIRSKRNAMIGGVACFTAIWGIIWVFAGSIDNYLFWFVITFLFGFFGGFMTLSFTQVKECFPTAISGTAVSSMNIFLFLGASICATITDVIIGRDYSLENFSVMWQIMFIFSVIALVFVFLSVERKQIA